jgi:hypothetical protein
MTGQLQKWEVQGPKKGENMAVEVAGVQQSLAVEAAEEGEALAWDTEDTGT